QYKDGLRNYIWRQVKDPDLADELTQEVLMKTYKVCCSDKEIKNVRSWLFQISQNIVYDHFKKQKRQINEVVDKPEPKEATVYKELAEYVEPLLGLLPDKYAIPLQLSDIEGLKQEEIANKLNLGLSATKSRIQRARNLLQKEISSCFYLDKDANGNLTDFLVKDNCQPLKNVFEKKCE
ncbi:sigma-70 family RNA polymerase sigma factor, partial [Xanthovirga aplysinae]|uniref:sigma-70 family RNA polymerase sigma factor n=1 Tax=Xanthovirga aplysinae TaxID=2529853 RepID=UPI0012BC6101